MTPKDIRTFRDAQLKAGKAAQTANLIVKCIRIAFNRAKRLGYITANPVEAIDTLPVEKAEKSTFTVEQIEALLKACKSEDWKGAILTAYYTGARLRDVTNLRWESIDLHKKLIEFTPAKTKKKIIIPLHPQLEAFFLKLNAPDQSKAFVFPSLSGKRSGGKSGLSMSFARIMERAGIRPDVVHEGKGKGRSIHTLSFHSLRHSFNSEMANAGISQEIRQKLTGHATTEMNKVYTHHEIKPLQQAIATLPFVRE